MRTTTSIACLILLTALLSGCARGPANREKADALFRWLGEQSYSTYTMFRHRDQSPHEPASPDGLTLGSPNVFAAIGCNPKDLMALDVLWQDQRAFRPLSKPMTVSLVSGLGGKPVANLPEQTLKRVRHTSIAVSQAEGDGLRVTAVDFAPMGSDDNFLVRWFLVENVGQSAERVRLSFSASASGDWRGGRGVWVKDNLAFVSDAKLTKSEEALEADLGRL